MLTRVLVMHEKMVFWCGHRRLWTVTVDQKESLELEAPTAVLGCNLASVQN